jgi:polysaccharide biosynthesis protein PslH
VRILYICHRFPFPPNRGGKIRPFQMIRHLSQRNEVTVASLAHTQEEFEAGAGLRDHCSEIIAEILPDSTRWPQAVLALPSSTPSSVAYFHSNRLRERIESSWRQKKYDAVMVHCAFVAQYTLGLQGPALRILDYGDMDSAKWMDYAEHRRFPLSAGYAIESRKLRRYEREMAKRFDRITITTQGENEEFKTLGVPKPCTVIPNGVDGNFFQPAKMGGGTKPNIVFLGRMDYFPNIDGVLWFVREVYPHIRRAMPSAELQIVGADPSKEILRLRSIEGVTVTGFVKDVRPYLTEAAVAIAPLRIARGTQNKILECMAAGIPVVSTPQAAKGIQAVAGEHIVVADGAQETSSSVLELLNDPARRIRIATSARAQVERAHSWPESMKVLDSVFAQGFAEGPSEDVATAEGPTLSRA